MKKLIFASLILVLVFFFSEKYALCQDFLFNEQQNVRLIGDTRVDSLVELHKKITDDGFQTSGYRVQIYFDAGLNSKKGAEDLIASFMEKYPEVSAYLTFREPYYRVRVGDFRKRIQAEGFLNKILKDYPNAFAIKESIIPGEIHKLIDMRPYQISLPADLNETR